MDNNKKAEACFVETLRQGKKVFGQVNFFNYLSRDRGWESVGLGIFSTPCHNDDLNNNMCSRWGGGGWGAGTSSSRVSGLCPLCQRWGCSAHQCGNRTGPWQSRAGDKALSSLWSSSPPPNGRVHASVSLLYATHIPTLNIISNFLLKWLRVWAWYHKIVEKTGLKAEMNNVCSIDLQRLCRG